MSATHSVPSAMLRASATLLGLLQKLLMVAGFVFLAGLFAIQAGHVGLIDVFRSVVVSDEPVADDGIASAAAADDAAEGPSPADVLSPRMQGALEYVAKRYRVSTNALAPVFAAAQTAGNELRLDPLLIIAVIGVESGFNPYSQSGYGAKGLMQVVPRFHMDKLPEAAGTTAFLDPVTNVQVGARVLKESISRYGGIESGLQQFGGALNDPGRRYSAKVLAEKQRLEQAARSVRSI